MRLIDADKLKPCPFCGGKADFDGDEEDEIVWVFCEDCRAEINAHSTKKEAIKAWNRRARWTE
jgi:Lar family restriction alleviation protein